MVLRLPGFAFQESGSGRGFSGTAGNVLIDGERPPSRGDSLSSIIARIPASGIERIDIIRGGADGIDMQGQPIVANIIRKADAGLTGAISGSTNVNNRGDVSGNSTLQVRNQAHGELMEGSLTVQRNTNSFENVYIRTALDGAVLRDSESVTDNASSRLNATAAWETTWQGGKLRVNGLLNAQRNEFDSAGVINFPGGLQDSAGRNDTLSGEAGVRYTRSLGEGFSLELVGFQSLKSTNFESRFLSAGIAGQDDYTSGSEVNGELGESILRATLMTPAFSEWSFEGGGEAVFNYSDRNAVTLLNGVPFLLGGDRSRVNELRADGFATAKWAPMPNLNLEIGARFEWSRITADSDAGDAEKTLTFLKPRVNLSWSPEQGHQLGLKVERVVDQLDFDSFASSTQFEQQIFGVGNPDAQPEKKWVVDARYERQFGGQNSLVLNYTHTDIDNILGRAILVVPGTPPDPDTLFEITRNSGRATLDELSLTGSLELDGLGIPGGIFSATGMRLESSLIDPVTGERHADSDRQPWSWSFSLQQSLYEGALRWNLSMADEGEAMGWRPHYLERRAFSPFLGASITWKPWPDWSISAGGNSLIAEDFVATSEFFNAPRTVGALPDYREYSATSTQRFYFVSVRKNF